MIQSPPFIPMIRPTIRGARAGATLLETLVVLLIMVTLLGVGMTVGGYLLKESNAREHRQLLGELATSIRLIKTQTGYPAGAQVGPTLARLELLPDALHVDNDGATITNAYGGQIQFHRYGHGGYVAIEYPNIPPEECRLLARFFSSEYLRAVGPSVAGLVHTNDLTLQQVDEFCDSGSNTLFFGTDTP